MKDYPTDFHSLNSAKPKKRWGAHKPSNGFILLFGAYFMYNDPYWLPAKPLFLLRIRRYATDSEVIETHPCLPLEIRSNQV